MKLESIVSKWPYAVIVLENGEIRPVCQLYDTDRGFIWLEPAYLDPYGTCSPAQHEFVGEVIEQDEDYQLIGNHSGRLEIYVGQRDGGALRWYRGLLEQQGKTHAEEHAYMRKAVLGS